MNYELIFPSISFFRGLDLKILADEDLALINLPKYLEISVKRTFGPVARPFFELEIRRFHPLWLDQTAHFDEQGLLWNTGLLQIISSSLLSNEGATNKYNAKRRELKLRSQIPLEP